MKGGDHTDAVFIAAATSADIFAAALGLRAAGVKLPAPSAAAVCISGAVILWLSAFFSSFLGGIIPPQGSLYISKALLLAIGFCTFFGISLPRKKKPTLYAEVINNPLSADCDHSNSISVTEGIMMGLALSADSVFTGIGAGVSGISLTRIFGFSLLFGALACALGMLAGRLLNRRDIPTGRIAGLILIIMALTMH